MKSKILVLLIVGFAVAAGVSSYYGRANLAEELNAKSVYVPTVADRQEISVRSQPIPLNPEDLAQNSVGELTFVKGWVLTSDNDDFGGWSGLLVNGTNKLTAINDQGNWLEADIGITAENILSDAVVSLFDPSVGEADKRDFDAESLVATQDGYLVGFEQEHRLMMVLGIGEQAELYDTGVDLTGLSDNSGIEAMTALPGDRLLMFAESGRDTEGRTPAWLVSPGSHQALDFKPPKNYEATDAATLPNGDVLLLMRYYSVLEGASAQVRHISAAEIDSGVILGRQIAEIKKPLNVDNMEGLDIEPMPDGRVRLYMISDDNFSMRQRTLFMVFDWKPDLALPANQ